MLIVALVLAVIGLGALVMAVVTSNQLIAWVCIAASVIGVVLLIVDALRDRSRGDADESAAVAEDSEGLESEYVEDYPDEAPIADDYGDTDYDGTIYGGTNSGDTRYDDGESDDIVAVDVESRPGQSPQERADDEPPKS